MSYDASRKLVSTTQNFNYSAATGLSTQYVPVPYDFTFTMSIYVRNTEDGTQIVEQILPFFTPDFTVTVDFIPEMDQKYDVPIILNSVNTTTDYEGGLQDGTTRLINWDLEFTVKGYIWPPVKSPTGGLIGGAYANTATGNTSYGRVLSNLYINEQSPMAQKVTVDYANGNNYFSTGETIRVKAREVTGKVTYFSNSNNGILIVQDLNKLLEPDDIVTGDYTNSKYTVISLDRGPLNLVSIVTQPDPVTAEADDEFGFSQNKIEFPDTI